MEIIVANATNQKLNLLNISHCTLPCCLLRLRDTTKDFIKSAAATHSGNFDEFYSCSTLARMPKKTRQMKEAQFSSI